MGVFFIVYSGGDWMKQWRFFSTFAVPSFASAQVFTDQAPPPPAVPQIGLTIRVPGPQQPLYFCGAEMVNQYGLGIVQNGQALFHTVLSYNGKLTLTAVSDRDIMPDPEFYASCLRDSFEEMRAAALPKPGRSRSGSGKGAAKKKSAKTTAAAE